MQELLAADTRQPVERIVRDVNRDFWMSAEDALACGIIETVIGQTEKVLAADPAEPGSGHRWSSIAATVQRQLQVVPVRVPGHLIDSIILTSDFRFLVAPRLAGSEVLVVGGVPNGRSGGGAPGLSFSSADPDETSRATACLLADVFEAARNQCEARIRPSAEQWTASSASTSGTAHGVCEARRVAGGFAGLSGRIDQLSTDLSLVRRLAPRLDSSGVPKDLSDLPAGLE
jgi:hypothetical protein